MTSACGASAGASIAVPYAVLIGIVNASVDLRLRTAGGFLRVDRDHGTAWEGFLIPAAIALVAGVLGGWSASASWHHAPARAVRAGLRAFVWASGLCFVRLLVFAAPGRRASSAIPEMWSGGSQRAALYIGPPGAPDPQRGDVGARPVDGRMRVAASRWRRARPALSRPHPARRRPGDMAALRTRQGWAAPPDVVDAHGRLLFAVPAAAIVIGFRRLGRTASSIPRAIVSGVGRGGVRGGR